MKKLRLILLAVLAFANANAQKLPNTQKGSLRAPANIKIDGKPLEWNNKMQAYNVNTEIFYTVANDEKKLYLIIQSKEFNVMRKIILGGVSLIIKRNPSQRESSTIKYPYFKDKNRDVFFMLSQNFEDGWHKDPQGRIADSLIKMSNKNLRAGVKWIYTKGLLGKDSVLSIYNEAGIEAMNGFDKSKIYTSEVAIDLNILGLSDSKITKFYYQIQINGEPNRLETSFTARRIRGVNSDGTPMNEAQVELLKQSMQAGMGAFDATTNFSGEYTLAK